MGNAAAIPKFEGPPEEPMDFRLADNSLTETSATFTWVPGKFRHAFFITYWLKYNEEDSGCVTVYDSRESEAVDDSDENIISYTLRNLQAGNLYKICIKARNRKGNSETSEPLLIQTKGLPEAPSNFHHVADLLTETTATFEWEPGKYRVYCQSFVISYKLKDDENNEVTEIIENDDLDKETITYTFRRLKAKQMYEFWIRTKNKIGISKRSEKLLVQTKGEMQDDHDDSRRASKTHSRRASKTQLFGFSKLSARKLPTFASENYSSGQRFRKESDNTLSQSMVDNYSNQMKSVGILIFDGEVMGTVFRVGSKYVMTALHIVAPIIDPAKAFIHFDESAVDSDRRYKVQKSFIFNIHLDVAVLEIEDDGRLRDLPPKMALSKYKFDGSEVSLIGYGNPNQSNRKNLDPRCLVIEPNSERMQYVLNWHLQNTEDIKAALRKNGRNASLVDLGYKGFDDDSQLMFDCFMVHGASGAPVLANNNAGSIQVVGVFTHGLPEFFFHLSDRDRLSVPKSCLLERGSKMNYIYTWIQRDYPEIVNDLFH